MKILGSVAIVRSSNRDEAAHRFAAIFGAPPTHEFPIEGRDLTVTVFPGVSVLSGSTSALDELANLRASIFVESLTDAKDELQAGSWTIEGSLGSGKSLLALDTDGNLIEFVESPG